MEEIYGNLMEIDRKNMETHEKNHGTLWHFMETDWKIIGKQMEETWKIQELSMTIDDWTIASPCFSS